MTATITRKKTNTYTDFDTVFERFRYPAGESHLVLRELADTHSATSAEARTIEARTTSFDDLAQIVTADRVLRRNGIEVEWFLPYFPFARHDRRNHAGDGFELGVALDMMRGLNVIVADPHSDVAGQLRHIPQTTSVECFRDAGAFAGDPVVVIPDAGASKKAYEWTEPDDTVVQALKHRDPATGQLSGFEVLVEDLGGAPCIIVDDICDGGGTFLGLAAELKAKNAGPLTLAVTHGLFTKGTTNLCRAFDLIITFDFAAGSCPAAGVEYLPFQDLYTKGQGARR